MILIDAYGNITENTGVLILEKRCADCLDLISDKSVSQAIKRENIQTISKESFPDVIKRYKINKFPALILVKETKAILKIEGDKKAIKELITDSQKYREKFETTIEALEEPKIEQETIKHEKEEQEKKQEKKYQFIEFTFYVSENCKPCDILVQQLKNDPDYGSRLNKDIKIVNINSVSDDFIKEYKIYAVPTLVAVDVSGEVVQQYGYDKEKIIKILNQKFEIE